MINKKTKLTIVAGVLGAMMSVAAYSDGSQYFPGASEDRRTMRAQALVENLYEAGEYERALIIYEKELAPIGDKYAQYMVGYMHLLGQGTEQDRPAALAWYRLAAERRDKLIGQARDALFKTMPESEIVRSNQIYVELWRELGDNQLILDLVRKDLEVLQARTGSRLPGSGTSQLAVVRVRPGESSEQISYERIEQRLQVRLDFLNANVEIVDVDLNDEMAVKESLEMELREEMAALEMR